MVKCTQLDSWFKTNLWLKKHPTVAREQTTLWKQTLKRFHTVDIKYFSALLSWTLPNCPFIHCLWPLYPFYGLRGFLLEPIPAVSGRGQCTHLEKSPAHHRALHWLQWLTCKVPTAHQEQAGIQYLAQGHFNMLPNCQKENSSFEYCFTVQQNQFNGQITFKKNDNQH